MNQTKIIAFIIFWSCCLAAQAQYTLLFQTGKFTTVASYQPFEVVEVIDARADTATVGMVYHADTKQTESIKTAQPLAEALMPYFGVCSYKSDKQIKISLKINYLEFGYRKIDKREYVWAYCDYGVYSKNESGGYSSDRKVCAVEGRASGYGMMSDIAKVNWLLWNDVFEQIKNVRFKFNKLATPLSETLAPVNSPAIVFADSIYTGIYTSYEEFVQNKPAITNYKLTKYNLTPTKTGPKEWLFEVPDSDGKLTKLKTNKIWGYCKNARVYTQIDEKQFIEIEPLGTSFEVAGMAIKAYQTGYRTPPKKAISLGGQVLAAYSRLFTTVPVYGGIMSAMAVIAFIGQIASDPNQRAIVTEKGWRPIPIYELKFHKITP